MNSRGGFPPYALSRGFYFNKQLYLVPTFHCIIISNFLFDGSKLTTDAESIGYTQKVARGEDLLTGYSKIVRMGPGQIYAGGTTIASHVVPEVGIGVMIERAKEEDTKWTFYDSWQKFNENADRASSKKYLDVEGDYYYRVRCIHSAGEDMSSSFTDGVYIEEP